MDVNESDRTPEQEDAYFEWVYRNPPTQTAEEADIENKGAAITEFLDIAQQLQDLAEELVALGVVGDGAFDALTDAISQATLPFLPEPDDRSLEDLS